VLPLTDGGGASMLTIIHHAVVSYEAFPIHFCNLASGTLRL